MIDLTQELLKQFLSYDPETGDWRWLVSMSNKVEGDAAGTISAHGYRIIGLFGVKYRAARLAFLYMTGEWPKIEADHINRCKLDDRWENLRDVSKSVNMINRGVQSNNASGSRGVHWDNSRQKWNVQVKKDSVNHFIGRYNTYEEAVAARDSAAAELHGEFAVLNQTQEDAS
jgi:hypothetical protein